MKGKENKFCIEKNYNYIYNKLKVLFEFIVELGQGLEYNLSINLLLFMEKILKLLNKANNMNLIMFSMIELVKEIFISK
jgi:hypothetical protein